MLKRLQAVLDRFEISIAEANDLVVLQDYECVVIADDSGSMQQAAEPSHMRKIGQPARTRWDELKETVAEIVEIASCFDETGVDVHFLNRSPTLKVKHSNDAAFLKAFEAGPRGTTPLTEVLQRLAGSFPTERGVLLFILTDGEPNGGKHPFIRTLTSLVSNAKVKVQIMVCTAEDDEVEWLNGVDKDLKQVDVTDDYFQERTQVFKTGLAPSFTRGDWCMKAMLGPVSRKFDGWDERLHPNRRLKQGECEVCCVM